MKSPIIPAFAAACLAIASLEAATVYSWESGTEGWSAGVGAAITTSTTGASHGSQSLQITAPMANMWYSTPASIGLDVGSRQSIFTGATTLTLDVSYPNPGYTSWWSAPTVTLVIQGEGVVWTELGERALTLDAAPQTLSWAVSPAQAASIANGSWGEVLLLFKYGNGGSSGTNAVFHVDNFTSDAVPEPSSALLMLGIAGIFVRRRRA